MIIDGVFSGGGIKGFAMIGALEVLEERGFSIKRSAGTSAGSIIASFLAAGYRGNEMKELLNEIDVSTLLDKRKSWLPIPFARWLLLYWKLGLYKGEALEKWVGEVLARRGVVTFADVPPQTLRIITSDITTGTLVVLPDDLPKYGINPLSFPIARAVRMSCAIPYFFEPVRIKNRHKKAETLFVDGGVLSNFPMWLFDSEHIKKVRPVIGMKLSSDEELHPPEGITNALEMFTSLFKTMKDGHDARYISRKHVKNIMFIPMKGISAVDFALTEESKEMLFAHGRECAGLFLRKWGY